MVGLILTQLDCKGYQQKTKEVYFVFCYFFQIFTIIRDPENPQKFSIEYVKGAVRTYLSTDRYVPGPQIRVRNRKLFFLFLNQNIYCWYSKSR